MVPRGVDHRHTVVTQAARLFQEKALGTEREPLTVEEIARHEERVNILSNREIGGPPERFPRGLTEPPPHGLGAARERGVEVDVGDVHEAHEPN